MPALAFRSVSLMHGKLGSARLGSERSNGRRPDRNGLVPHPNLHHLDGRYPVLTLWRSVTIRRSAY